MKAIDELHAAVESGDFKAIQKCLDAGASIDGVLGKTSYRVLHKAAREGSIEMVEFLIERGAMVNARILKPDENYGWIQFPLDMAIKKNRKKVIELLRSNGGKTDVELTDKTSVTWLKMRLDAYKSDIGHFPKMLSEKEGGLTALFKKPKMFEDDRKMMDKKMERTLSQVFLKMNQARTDEWGKDYLSTTSRASVITTYSLPVRMEFPKPRMTKSIPAVSTFCTNRGEGTTTCYDKIQ